MHVMGFQGSVGRGLELYFVLHLILGHGTFTGRAGSIEARTAPSPNRLRQGKGSSMEPPPDLLPKGTLDLGHGDRILADDGVGGRDCRAAGDAPVIAP